MRSKECDKAENAARDSFDREDFTNGTFRTGGQAEKREGWCSNIKSTKLRPRN